MISRSKIIAGFLLGFALTSCQTTAERAQRHPNTQASSEAVSARALLKHCPRDLKLRPDQAASYRKILQQRTSLISSARPFLTTEQLGRFEESEKRIIALVVENPCSVWRLTISQTENLNRFIEVK